MRFAKILERILATFPIMFGVALIVFLFMRFTPGDPVDLMMGEAGNVSQEEVQALRDQFNLDEPVYIQIKDYFQNLLQGDLGESFKKRRPVLDLIAETLPATIELAIAASIFAIIVGIPIGVYSAVRQKKLVDRLSMGASFLGISMPPFWLGIVLIFIFSVKLGWTPVKGRLDFGIEIQRITGLYVLDSLLTNNWAGLKSALKHLILPSITLGSAMAAIVARVTRSSMLEALSMDYVSFARAKGLVEWKVILIHTLRNALIPTVTVIGLEIGVLLGGNMIVETVFSWPGLGRLAVDGIFNRDYPLVQGVVMFYAFTFVMANLIVDIIYTYLNPKLRI
ncbi:ABC transporter permease [Microaerobacter geothermalis]|uniref:nickel ABC transporter permease n=1 Tax=Microaerobacter geothermalis TaxID=674972 RepID=UPI001F31EB76|nr:nickel ABC transporter permease [Microaerobacter geothermalis]MCF6093862.1 ABC transporter permease [Microaerobacter geothermalis]